MGFLGAPFEVGVGGKTNPWLKLIRMMPEILFVSIHSYAVLENVVFSTKTPLILIMSVFFCKKNKHFVAKIAPLLNMRAVLEFVQIHFQLLSNKKLL